MNTDDIVSLAGFATAAVFVVQFLRNLIGPKLLSGTRTQLVAMLVSIGFGYLAANSSREFEAETDTIIGTVVLVFMLGQSIYNLAFRDTALEATFDTVTTRVLGKGTDDLRGGGDM